MSRALAHNVTERALDAAFFASLDELRWHADQAVEASTRLRAANHEMNQSLMARGGGDRSLDLPGAASAERPWLSCRSLP